MGGLGVDLYDDDIACDVKATYEHALFEGVHTRADNEETLNDNKAYERAQAVCLAELSGNPETDAVVWFVLADVQWDYGVLTKEVKAKALEYLARDEHLQTYKEAGEETFLQRVEVLRRLKEKIASPMPDHTVTYQVEDASSIEFDFKNKKPIKNNLKKYKVAAIWSCIALFLTILIAFVGDFIAYSVFKAAAGNFLMTVTITGGVIWTIVLVVICALYLSERAKVIHTFFYGKEDGIYTYLNGGMGEETSGSVIALDFPVYINSTGVYADGVALFLWCDCDGLVYDESLEDPRTKAWYIRIRSEANKNFLWLYDDVANYCAVKRFCTCPIANIEFLDERFKGIMANTKPHTMPENNTTKTQPMPEFDEFKPASDAVKFTSFFWLISTLFYVVGMAVIIGIGVALVISEVISNAGVFSGAMGVALVGAEQALLRNFPRGTTYIDKNYVYTKSFSLKIKFRIEETTVHISGLFITFTQMKGNEVLKKTAVFNTQKARNLIKTLPFKNIPKGDEEELL